MLGLHGPASGSLQTEILPGVGEGLIGKSGQVEGIIEFPNREQPGIGGDRGAVRLQLEAAVESEPKTGFSRFIRRVLRPEALARQLSR